MFPLATAAAMSFDSIASVHGPSFLPSFLLVQSSSPNKAACCLFHYTVVQPILGQPRAGGMKRGRDMGGRGTGKWNCGRWPARYTRYENEWLHFPPKRNYGQAIYGLFFPHRLAGVRTLCPLPFCWPLPSIDHAAEHCDTRYHAYSWPGPGAVAPIETGIADTICAFLFPAPSSSIGRGTRLFVILSGRTIPLNCARRQVSSSAAHETDPQDFQCHTHPCGFILFSAYVETWPISNMIFTWFLPSRVLRVVAGLKSHIFKQGNQKTHLNIRMIHF